MRRDCARRSSRLFAMLAAFSVAIGAHAGVALAAPVHPFLEASSLDGSSTPSGSFDHACGVAVDSEGDVYVANSGNASIDVFGPSGGYLTSIADGGQPCDLAVDSEGDVYAVDVATKDVVRYAPSVGAYPPALGQTYSASVLDASGEATAVATDSVSGRVFVATPTHVDAYNSDGVLAGNEIQEARIRGDGGTFKLSFKGASTTALAAGASAAQVQSALEALPTIGAGSVAVTAASGEGGLLTTYKVIFQSALGDADVPPLEADISSLTATSGGTDQSIVTVEPGWHRAVGVFSDGYGIGVWSASGDVYVASEAGVIYVFDPTGTKVLSSIDGSGRPGGPYGSLPEANVAVDQANGHVFVAAVATGGSVDEFEATGPFVSQTTHSFASANPSALAVDPSEGPTAGRLYVTSASGAGSQVYAFGPLPTPTHSELPNLAPKASETPAGQFQDTCGVAVDSQGDIYVASMETSAINIYKPEGSTFKYLTTISDNNKPCDLAVDASGNVFVSHPNAANETARTVVAYSPNAYPFIGIPTYGAPKIIDNSEVVKGVAIDPTNQHILVAHPSSIFEYSSLGSGATLIRNDIAAGLLGSSISGVAVYGKTGYVYATSNSALTRGINIIDPATNELLQSITGANLVSRKPDGALSGLAAAAIAIDQSNGHVYVSPTSGEDVYEFEASGAYASRLGRKPNPGSARPGIAVDNSGGPNAGDVFVAGGILNPNPAVRAFGPAKYGAAPAAVAVSVSDVTGSSATLHGTVDPEDAVLETCRFEYVDNTSFEATGFSSAHVQACSETPTEIGSGSTPVPVSASISGLAPGGRYHYRLFAKNQFGQDTSGPQVFGPPSLGNEAVDSSLYTEAVLGATVDPSGVPTHYFVEYGPSEQYGNATAEHSVEGQSPSQVEVSLFGLQPATVYHFRFVASNVVETVFGPDRTFTTLSEPGDRSCPNAQFRTGRSASLPDCRAYELVSPPDANGLLLQDLRDNESDFFDFLAPMVSPNGDDALFYSLGTLPGAGGNGYKDAYRSRRGPNGWTIEVVSPQASQANAPKAGGATPAHDYSFWSSGTQGGSLELHGEASNYLRFPDGSYQLVGIGGTGTDPAAHGRWISEGAAHVIFTSTAHLSPDAPPAGTEAIYDRAAQGLARLVSKLPNGSSPAAGENATFLGASADGSSVAFTIGSTLYLGREGQTFQVATGHFAFGGLSSDGTKLFYVQLFHSTQITEVQRGEIERFDATSNQSTAVGSGGESVLVDVPADGDEAYFASRRQLDGAKGTLGDENLYRWNGSGVTFIATVADSDIEASGSQAQRLGMWARNLNAEETNTFGPGRNASRSNGNGQTFVFESSANLTTYDSEGHLELYAYSGGQLSCISCPDGPASSNASFQSVKIVVGGQVPTTGATQISSVSEDGAVFFQTSEGLVPWDQNGVQDVYEWRSGATSLISSGKSPDPSYLYGASPSGQDVLVITSDTLLPADVDNGAPSIYDARVDGGFAAERSSPCQGDGCREGIAQPPVLPSPSSTDLSGPGNVRPQGHKRCRKKGASTKGRARKRCGFRHHGHRTKGAHHKHTHTHRHGKGAKR